MIACASGNRSSRHGYLVGNAICNMSSRHGNPMDSAITLGAVEPNKVYVVKNLCPISIVQLDEVSEISWRKKAGFYLLNSSLGSLSGGHNMLDLITLVDNNVTMDT